jgi:methionyl-tRNA formyltransferase
MLKKEDGYIDWSQPAIVIERMVRAFDPWPATFTTGPRGPLKILAAKISEADIVPSAAPGTILKFNKQPHVATGRGALRLVTVQPAGKKPMPAEAMMNGQPELWGSRLGVQ